MSKGLTCLSILRKNKKYRIKLTDEKWYELSDVIEKELKVLDFLKDIVDVEEYKEGSYCLVDLCSDNKDHICDIDKETYNLFKEVIKNERM